MPTNTRLFMTAIRSVALAAALSSAAAALAQSCSATSGATIAPVVELYTSEGCSSCPPADKWLSRLKADPAAVALAFHVDYWDRLGWKDRFASPAFTQRQAQQQATSGARFSYTPQVLIDGADRPDWPRALGSVRGAGRAAATVALTLVRDGDRYTGTVTPGHSAPARLAGYWAVTEQGHSSAVKAGENNGATLEHDFVVRDYRPLAAWPASGSTAGATPAQSFSFDPATAPNAAHPRRVSLVVVDTATGRPVQAISLGC